MNFTVCFFLEQGQSKQRFEFNTPGIYSIGRGKDCSLTIPQKQGNSLSRMHCQIILTSSEVFLRDAGSINGTFVNDRVLADGSQYLSSNDYNATDVKIHDGDKVKLGNYIFQIKIREEENIPILTTTDKGTIILPAIRGK